MAAANSAQLYLDHNASAGIANHLRRRGCGARTARELGLARAHDHLHLLTAARNEWTLVTCDWEDFRLLNEAWRDWPAAWGVDPPPRHAGILVIPAPDYARQRWQPQQAADEIIAFLAQQPLLTNTLFRWRPNRGWIRY